jgi:hypothetical protein
MGNLTAGEKSYLELPPFPVIISPYCILVSITKTHASDCSTLTGLEVPHYCHPLFFPRHKTQYMQNNFHRGKNRNEKFIGENYVLS